MAQTLDLCKNAASIAVDSVFSSVLAKLSGGKAEGLLSGKISSPKYNPMHSEALNLPDELRGPTVQWAIEEEKSQYEKEEENIMRQKAKRTADRYSKTTDLLRRAKILEEQMKQKADDVQQVDNQDGAINADGVDFPSMTQTQIQNQLAAEGAGQWSPNKDQVQLIKQLQATDSEVFGGMVAKGGRRSIEEAGFTSPAELDENMRRHKEAQRRLRKKRVELEKKKQQRLMAEKAEQEMLRKNIERNEERRKRLQAEHEAERKRLLAERVEAQKLERQRRREERQNLLKNESKMKKVKKKPLFKRMEEEYNERVLMPELLRRKEKLAAIHKRFKESSPALADIDMHQRAVQAQERLNRERSRLKRRGREKVWNQSRAYYTGKTKLSILEEQRSIQTQEQKKLRMKKLIRAKQKAYGEFVRKQVAPRIDPDKSDEVKERISKLKKPAPLRREQREKESLNAVVQMEPQRPSQSNLHYKSMRAKEQLDEQLMKEQAQLEKPSHRMRSRNDALETARFLNAKEQAKQDMRIRRERRRQKQLAERGIKTTSPAKEPRPQQQKLPQRRAVEDVEGPNSFSLPTNDMSGVDPMGDAPLDTPGRAKMEEAEHAKLSNMYMQAMQAKMQELEQMGDE